MGREIPDNEIITMFQRYLSTSDPSEVNKLDPDVLAAAEARLALKGTHPSFIEAIKTKRQDLELKEQRKYQSQLKDCELKEQRKHESRVRKWSLVTAFVIGIAVTIVGQWLWGIINGGTI